MDPRFAATMAARDGRSGALLFVDTVIDAGPVARPGLARPSGAGLGERAIVRPNIDHGY
jgi:hypothetical protein